MTYNVFGGTLNPTLLLLISQIPINKKHHHYIVNKKLTSASLEMLSDKQVKLLHRELLLFD